MDRTSHQWGTEWRRLASSNVDVAAYTEPAGHLAAAPESGTGYAVLNMKNPDGHLLTDSVHNPRFLELIVIGEDTDGDGLLVTVLGWTKCKDTDDADWNDIYIKTYIGEITATLGARLNPDSTGNFYADTLALTDDGYPDAREMTVISPAGNTNASILLDTRGVDYLSFYFTGTGTAGTAGNVLYRGLSEG